jgi:hypothetical protein
MLKQIILTVFRCGLGFLLVSALFMVAMQPDALSQDTNKDMLNGWFYFGTMKVWVAGTALALLTFFITLPERGTTALRWSPVWLPLLYGSAALIYLGSGYF